MGGMDFRLDGHELAAILQIDLSSPFKIIKEGIYWTSAAIPIH